MDGNHSLLKRQIKKYLTNPESLPPEFLPFIEAINDAYNQFDEDRLMLERSLDLSSQELLQANARMTAMFKGFPDHLLLVDDTGTVKDCKIGNVNALKLKPHLLIGKKLQETSLSEFSGLSIESLHQVLNSKTRKYFQASKVIEQQELFLEIRFIPVSVDQVIVIMRDITEREKHKEERLKAQKLESIGILAGGIAHDFNNILTGILGNITLAKMNDEDGEPVGEKLENAEKAALRARELTKQFLTFSKGGAPVKMAASMVELIRESTTFILRGSNVKCKFLLPDDLWAVDIDRGQINQVINNITINADHAMPDGGTITIRGENIIIHDDSDASLEPGKYLKISITDSGTGIPPGILKKIFDPYFTTKTHGSGLGLASSYGIIKKHDGHIRVESTIGVGTTFEIFLPASHETILSSDVIGQETTEQIIKGKGCILLMDDDEVILQSVPEQLGYLGYEVEATANGEELIEKYTVKEETGDTVDLVILDLTVPGGMGGEKTIEHLLEINPQVKAIVASGYSNNPVMANYKKYGFSGVVVKPFDIKELSKEIHRVIQLETLDTI
ncbi:MAG: response regulator [bacterium]|nr:response regulator [bacterium]